LVGWPELNSDLPAGTAGTGRVHPRRAADRAGTGTAGRRVRVDFFFKTVPYPSHIRARRGYTGTGTEVLGHTGRGESGTGSVITFQKPFFTGRRVREIFFCCFCFTNIFFILECRKI
jgi:hypothetical protein